MRKEKSVVVDFNYDGDKIRILSNPVIRDIKKSLKNVCRSCQSLPVTFGEFNLGTVAEMKKTMNRFRPARTMVVTVIERGRPNVTYEIDFVQISNTGVELFSTAI